MRLTAAATLAIALTTIVAMPVAAAPPDPSHVYVHSVTYGGSGCPQGSVGTSFADGRESFTIIFDRAVASSGPGVPITESQKSCQITVNLHVPQGAGNTIARVTYRGYASIPEGMTAERSAEYYVGGSDPVSRLSSLTGPLSQDYAAVDALPLHLNKVDLGETCSAAVPLNVNAHVRLVGELGAAAQVTIDSIDVEIQQTGNNASAPC